MPAPVRGRSRAVLDLMGADSYQAIVIGAGPGGLATAAMLTRLNVDRVVIASGHQRVPYLPDWPRRETFSGELIHSASYRNPAPYSGRDVLVVGTGDSGSGIALDLARNGAARVRTGPNIVIGDR